MLGLFTTQHFDHTGYKRLQTDTAMTTLNARTGDKKLQKLGIF